MQGLDMSLNEREKPMEEAKHLDSGKPDIQYLLAMEGLEDVAACGTYGEKKYQDRFNYRIGMPWMKILGSCARHLRAFIRGEDLDPESGLPHLAHLIYDALMVLDYTKNHKGLDNRPKSFTKKDQ